MNYINDKVDMKEIEEKVKKLRSIINQIETAKSSLDEIADEIDPECTDVLDFSTSANNIIVRIHSHLMNIYPPFHTLD